MQIPWDWVRQYGEAHGRKLVYVEVNRGMVDSDHAVPFSWPDSMSNKPGRDGLHPNEQGSMVIANNLAEAMGITEAFVVWPEVGDIVQALFDKKKEGEP